MLTERQRQILKLVVENYVTSAEPVGSRTLSKSEDISYSSATIRNEMADLEDLGYLEQPHTSAGRIPSEKGYRFYVDHLMRPMEVTLEQYHKIRKQLTQNLMERENIIGQTAQLIAQLTHYTALILGPEFYESSLKHVQILPISDDGKAVMIIVTDNGRVENRKVQLPEGVPFSEVEKLVKLLNLKLHNVPLSQLKKRLYDEVSEELKRHFEHYHRMMGLLDELVRIQPTAEKVYLGGTTNILSQPEFQDVEKIRVLFELFEDESEVFQLFSEIGEGVQVRIGQENKLAAVNQCSFVTVAYTMDGQPIGSIGILGPTRMDYRKVLGILHAFSMDFAHLFQQWYKNEI